MKDILQNGKLLIVGDGDFSFSVSLLKHSSINPHQVYTSNLETEPSILRHVQAYQNMETLKDMGASVFLETDARDLHNHPVISNDRFDNVVFNFPLADRHNIKKNRSLLADFFLSCKSVLASKGRILVTLCKGQGGTPADQPMRSWHDSWQVVAMATNAGFLLREVLPFDPSDFPDYHSVGFRFQDKSFNVTRAITHVFEEGLPVEDFDSAISRGKLMRNGETYSCSSYVASALKRDLLKESKNPLSILKEMLERGLDSCPSARNLVVENRCGLIIPSHKATAYYLGNGSSSSSSSAGLTEKKPCITSETPDKDWKNRENMERMNKKAFSHGVDVSGGAGEVETKSTLDYSAPSTFLLGEGEKENVYILVKAWDVNTTLGNSGNEQVAEMRTDLSCDSDSEHLSSSNDNTETEMARHPGSISGHTGSVAGCNISCVYHLRTSLLEDLPSLCQTLNRRTDFMNENTTYHPVSGEDIESGSAVSPASDSDGHTDSTAQSSSSSSSVVSSLSLSSSSSLSHKDVPNQWKSGIDNDFPCLVTSGQCMIPCPITRHATPVKQEMMIIHLIASSANDLNLPRREQSQEINRNLSNKVTSQVLSLLQSLNSRSVNPCIFVHQSGDYVNEIGIDGGYKAQLIGHLVSNEINESSETKRSTEPVGSTLAFRMEECLYHVTVIDLQSLLCSLCGIDDPRVLWSESDKFYCQFPVTNLSLCTYRPFSLYPMKFVHDLSFWESDSEAFDEFGLYESVRNIAGDLVVTMDLIDVYQESNSNRRSRCYRLHFVSADKCLPYIMSWKLQSRIRMEVARSLGVQLR